MTDVYNRSKSKDKKQNNYAITKKTNMTNKPNNTNK